MVFLVAFETGLLLARDEHDFRATPASLEDRFSPDGFCPRWPGEPLAPAAEVFHTLPLNPPSYSVLSKMTVSYEYSQRGSHAVMAPLENRFEVMKEIGDGSFGSVVLARVRGAGSQVARRGTLVRITPNSDASPSHGRLDRDQDHEKNL